MTPAHRPVWTAAAVAACAIWLVVRAPIAAQQQMPAAPPQDQPVFRAGTSLVPVDVRVLDRNGQPITDLTRDDFVVVENGVRQRVDYFTTQTFTPEAAASDAVLRIRTHQSEDLTPQNRRVFLIVLGRGRLQPPAKGVDGMLHFVRERLLPQDLVAVLAWDRATEFTTDHEKIAALLERFKKTHERIESQIKNATSGLAAIYGTKDIPASLRGDIDAVFGGPAGSSGIRSTQSATSPHVDRMNTDNRQSLNELTRAVADDTMAIGQDPRQRETPSAFDDASANLEQFVQANARTMQDLSKLYLAVEYLRHVEGEKHLVFVSESGLILPRAEDDKDLAAAASDARVVIDYVHTGGVVGVAIAPRYTAAASGAPGNARVAPPSPAMQNDRWVFSTARSLASLTGGRFFGNQLPNAAADMDQIDAGTRFEYLLGYTSANQRLDGRYRNITVRVNRPGATLLYRHGYYANPEIAPFNRQRVITYSRIAAAANYAKDVPDIPLKVTAKAAGPTPGTVQLQIAIDPTPLAFTRQDGRNVDAVELAVFCVDDGERLVGESWKTVQLNFADDRLIAVKRDGIDLQLAVPMQVPARRAKVIVYDYRADLIGSVVVKIQ